MAERQLLLVSSEAQLPLAQALFPALEARHMNGGDWSSVRFAVFDNPLAKGHYKQRLATVRSLLGGNPNCYVVEQEECQGHAHIREKMDGVVKEQNWEGLILRDPSKQFRAGRSSELLKVKDFLDEEAIVVAFEKVKRPTSTPAPPSPRYPQHANPNPPPTIDRVASLIRAGQGPVGGHDRVADLRAQAR